MKKKWLVIGFSFFVLCLVSALYFTSYQAKKEQVLKTRQTLNSVKPELTANLNADSYGLSVSNYNRLMSIKNQALQKRKVSDNELNWMLSLLNPNAPEILHYRIFAILQLLGNAPDHQKDAIRSAIQPYLSQSNPRYHNSMKRIQKFVFGVPDWQPSQ